MNVTIKRRPPAVLPRPLVPLAEVRPAPLPPRGRAGFTSSI